MMRIPRIGFACLLVLLAVLSSRLAMVEVRAHSDGSVLTLKLTPAAGDSIHCDLSTTDAKHDSCGGLAQVDNANLFYGVKVLKRDGSRVLLSLRSRVTAMGPASYGPETESTLPETQSWFTPGETLPLPDTGKLKLTLTGEWADHIPVGGNQLLDPGPDEIRLTSPLLLKNSAVVGDLGDATADGEAAYLYVPGEGRFLLSSTPIPGAVVAAVQFNRVSFESDGQKYSIVNGMPVCRGEKLWVLHDAAYKLPPDAEQGPMVGTTSVKKPL